jgi:hypothetical protein
VGGKGRPPFSLLNTFKKLKKIEKVFHRIDSLSL